MRFLEKISEFVGKWMAVVVLVIAALSLFIPKSTLWIELSWVNYLLMVVMFGMGLTLREGDREYYYEALDKFFPGVWGLRLSSATLHWCSCDRKKLRLDAHRSLS